MCSDALLNSHMMQYRTVGNIYVTYLFQNPQQTIFIGVFIYDQSLAFVLKSVYFVCYMYLFRVVYVGTGSPNQKVVYIRHVNEDIKINFKNMLGSFWYFLLMYNYKAGPRSPPPLMFHRVEQHSTKNAPFLFPTRVIPYLLS